MESKDLSKLRIVIGFLAILIIPICYLITLWNIPHEVNGVSSYSAFYWTNARNFFVGGISILALFYAVYNGYGVIDRIVNITTCILLIGVVLFPAMGPDVITNKFQPDFNVFPELKPSISDILHIICGTGSLIIQAANVALLFTKTSGEMTKQKKIRNIIYYSVGALIIVCFIVVLIDLFSNRVLVIHFPHTIFVVQIICFTLVGVCWLIKGGLFKFLNDER